MLIYVFVCLVCVCGIYVQYALIKDHKLKKKNKKFCFSKFFFVVVRFKGLVLIMISILYGVQPLIETFKASRQIIGKLNCK